MVIFWLQTEAFGQRLLYILQEPTSDQAAVITGIHWVSVEGGEAPDPERITS